LAYGFQSAAGGNLSGTFTSVPFIGWSEGMPLFGLGRGPQCQLGSSKVPLGGEALQKYNTLKQALLSGGYLTCQECSTFFNENTERGAYFSQLTDAVTNQVPYDGVQTTISIYDAGLWTAVDTAHPNVFPSVWERTPVCAYLRKTNTIKVAAAQVQGTATDVYLNTESSVLNRYLSQSTILHEALHNRTGLGDGDLAWLLGIELPEGAASHPINTTLENNRCAARPGH
jgi:hypothetical protein